MVYYGSGVTSSNAKDELNEFLDIADIPSTYTLMAAGCVGSENPRNLREFFASVSSVLPFHKVRRQFHKYLAILTIQTPLSISILSYERHRLSECPPFGSAADRGKARFSVKHAT